MSCVKELCAGGALSASAQSSGSCELLVDMAHRFGFIWFSTFLILCGLVLSCVAFCAMKPKKPRPVDSPVRLPNGMFASIWSKFEADFLYKEIFEKRAYHSGGIHLQPGATVVDAGANVGMFSLWCYRECQGDVDIFAFEPIPTTFEVLNANATSYGPSRIHTFNHGLSDQETDIQFSHHPNISIWSTGDAKLSTDRVERIAGDMATLVTGGKAWLRFLPHFLVVWILKLLFVFVNKTEIVNCKLRCLKDIIREQNLEHIDLLKVDVEGAELMVLKGIDEGQWDRIDQVALEVESFERVEQVREFLEERGFHTRWVASEREEAKSNSNMEIASEVSMVYATREARDEVKTDSKGYIVEDNTAHWYDAQHGSDTTNGSQVRRRRRQSNVSRSSSTTISLAIIYIAILNSTNVVSVRRPTC